MIWIRTIPAMTPITDGHHAQNALFINGAALAANIRLLAAKTTAIMAAVVKADSYGINDSGIFKLLMTEGCRDFFVATLPEADRLRATTGIAARIFILNGITCAAEAQHAANQHFIPVLNTPTQIQIWQQYAQNHPAALHVDTGMNRLGVTLTDWQNLGASLNLCLILSHLACADIPNHPLNRLQKQRFDDILSYFPGIPASLAASSGVFLGTEYHYDMVRCGIALYGGNPVPSLPNPMRPVVSLCGKILQIQAVKAGQTIGYTATPLLRDSVLATVALGYADGVPRSLSHRSYFYHGQTPLPVFGRISMDLTILDITDHVNDIQMDDWLYIFNEQQTIEHIATQTDTISYEILTRLGKRPLRIFLPSS